MSKDVVAVATLFGGVAVLRVVFGRAVDNVRELFAFCLNMISGGAELEAAGAELYAEFVSLAASSVLPIMLVICLLAVIATMAQTRGLVAFEKIKPKFENISPAKGFKRLFSANSLVEALKNLLKVIILLVLIYTCIVDLMDVAEQYMRADLLGACTHLLQSMFTMLLKVGAAFLVLAAADFGYQRWSFEKQMKMTKQEVKEEFKQTEGDPQVKGKIKQIQRQMAQSRMMQQVPGADVVVRNPTHFAVALRYHAGEDEAPVVLAKGQDHLAQRIVEVAELHGISVIENVPLARALYAQTELNQQIPPELYEGVAEVMVYLYKLGKLKGHERYDPPS